VIKKEPEHLPRGVGSLGICVGRGGAATRPGMTRSVYDPLLEDYLPARVMMQDAAVGAATRYPTFLNRCSQIDIQRFPKLHSNTAISPESPITVFSGSPRGGAGGSP
jgi:hypothetical protein